MKIRALWLIGGATLLAAADADRKLAEALDRIELGGQGD